MNIGGTSCPAVQISDFKEVLFSMNFVRKIEYEGMEWIHDGLL
jgi:hypothetical protein